ncbi:hypothetical protein [Brevibacillus panacihumi]|nr:hypothetical protein [Brevibacillus panacihumi]
MGVALAAGESLTNLAENLTILVESLTILVESLLATQGETYTT